MSRFLFYAQLFLGTMTVMLWAGGKPQAQTLDLSEMSAIVGGVTIDDQCCTHYGQCDGTASACGDFVPNEYEPAAATCAKQPWVLINSANNTKHCQIQSPYVHGTTCTHSDDVHICRQTRFCYYNAQSHQCVVAGGTGETYNVADSCTDTCPP